MQRPRSARSGMWRHALARGGRPGLLAPALCLVAASGCGSARVAGGSGDPAPVGDECVALRSAGEPPAMALLVPALGFEAGSYVQVDTGADASVFYGQPGPRRTLSVFPDLAVTPPFRSDLAVETLPDGGRIVGTAGTDVLAGRTLLFDPLRSLLCEVAEPPAALTVPSRFEHGKVFVTLSAGQQRFEHFALDTGAQFGLVVDPPVFEALTGRSPEDASNRRIEVPAWGARLEVATAPSRDDVLLDGRSLGRLEVATVPATPDLFARVRRFPLGGLLGWPALADRPFAITLAPRDAPPSEAR